MANQLLTPQVIAMESLEAFQNQLPFVRNAVGTDEDYTARFGKSGAKIGDTLTLRKTVVLEADEGPVITDFQDVIEPPVPLTIEKQFKVPLQFGSRDLTLTVDNFRERYIVPAITALANKVEVYALTKAYRGIANSVGTAATIPNGTTALKTYLQANALLDKNATPVDDKRCLMITPDAQVEAVDALKGLFQSSSEVSKQYMTGRMGKAAGFDWYMSQLLRTHTVGAYAGSGVTASAGQTGSSINTSGWTAGAAILKAGDVVTFAGAYRLNPLSFDTQADLKQFTVAADVTADGSGLATIPLVQPIVISGPTRNVSAAPGNGATVTIYGGTGAVSPQMIAWHPAAFGFAAPPMQDVSEFGAWCARATDKKTGISIRLTRQFSAREDMVITRLDILCGFVVRNPNMAVRIWS